MWVLVMWVLAPCNGSFVCNVDDWDRISPKAATTIVEMVDNSTCERALSELKRAAPNLSGLCVRSGL